MMRDRCHRWGPAGALFLYLTVSVAYFGWPVLKDPRHYTVGSGPDPGLFIWFLVWWPYALRHGINPFFTKLVWAPDGVNLAWSTSVPAAALPAAPITLSFGPVVAYNVLALLAPALAAWTAFLLCRRLTAAFLPALLGGYFFGFSSYELAHLEGGHLNLSLTFVLPLLALAALLFYEERLRGTAFVLVATVLLVLQFGISTEMFATATFWGTVAFLLALAFNTSAGRMRMMRLAWRTALAYILAAIVLGPYLYYVVKGLGDVPGLIVSPITYSADVLNYVVPTPVTWLGGDAFAGLSSHFSGNYTEADAYLGPPLIVLCSLYGFRNWPARRTKALMVWAAALFVASLGPLLHVAGVQGFPMLWALSVYVPLLRHALPARFTVYLTLITAVIVALWLNDRQGRAWWRWGLVAFAALVLLPNLGALSRYATRETPSFFAAGDFRRLAKNENTIVIPYGYAGDSMIWQAAAGMWFPMSGGYLGPLVPPSFARSFVTYALYAGAIPSKYQICLRPYLAAHKVRTIIIAGPDQGKWRWLSPMLGVQGTPTGGVTVYRVPSAVLSDPRDDGVCGHFLLDEFGDLVQAAKRYAARGNPVSALTPLRAEQMGLLPAVYGGYTDAARENWTQVQGWLGPWGSDGIAVGVLGDSREIAPIIERYRRLTKLTYFPYPHLLAGAPPPARYGRLFMVLPVDQQDK
jgi:hypothetical protein